MNDDTSMHVTADSVAQFIERAVTADWPTQSVDVAAFFEQLGVRPAETEPTARGSLFVTEVWTAISETVGYWSESKTGERSLSAFPYSTEPVDRAKLFVIHTELKSQLVQRWGKPSSETVGALDAPRATWDADGIEITVDCFWTTDVIGVIQIGLRAIPG